MAEPATPLAEGLPATPRDHYQADLRRLLQLTEEEFAVIFCAGDFYAAAMVEACARTPQSQRGNRA